MSATDEAYAHDVFISYASSDRDWVRTVLLPRLESDGLRVWIDYRDAVPGAFILSEIDNAITGSRRVVLVISRAYLESAWTELERNLVQTLDPAARERRLVPLLLENCSLPSSLRSLIYVNLANQPDDALEWSKLRRVLGAGFSPSESSPPSNHLGEAQRSNPPAASSVLRKCIAALFANEDELRDFCFEYFPEVHRNLREIDRLPYITRTLIQYCTTRGKADFLWSQLRTRNAQVVDTMQREIDDSQRTVR